jgi:hypothetical protein
MKRKSLVTFLAVFYVLFFSIGTIPAKANSNVEISSITVNKKDILVANEQKITVNLTDSSGVSYINVTYKQPSGSYTQYLLGQNGQGGFDGYAMAYGSEGTMTVSSIIVNFSNGSYKYFEDIGQGGTYDLSGGDFTIHSSDTTGPVFNSVSVNTTQVVKDGSVIVTVNAEDMLSDIQSVELTYQMPDGWYTGEKAVSIGNNQYQLAIPFYLTGGYHGFGTYKLASISLTDSQNNTSYVWDDTYIKTADLSSGNFTVIPEGDGPVLKNISVDKTEVTSGQPVKLSAEVEDASGVAEVRVIYTQPNGYNHTVIFNHSHDNIYVGEITGDFTGYYSGFTVGYWTPRIIMLKDIYGSTTDIWSNLVLPWGQDLSYLNFYVKERDFYAPNAPSVNEVDENTTTLYGYAEHGSTVTAYVNGYVIGSTVVTDGGGYYQMYIGNQAANTQINVNATDASGNVSQDTVVVVKDVTAPGKPTVNDVSDQDTAVTGHAEPGSTVSVSANGAFVALSAAGIDGSFYVSIPVQTAGTELTVTATDQAGHTSEAATLIVLDRTAPVTPTVNDMTEKDTVVKGKTEANAQVTVYLGTTVLGTGKADASGAFSISITKQKAGSTIDVAAKDEAGNESRTTFVTKVSYSLVKIQLNGKAFTNGYFGGGTTYVHWKALEVLKIPFTYKGDGTLVINGRTVKGEHINGGLFIRWTDLAPGKVTYKAISGGFNFLYSPPVKVQLNGKDFLEGYLKNDTIYVHWSALKTFNIPYTFKGGTSFTIGGRSVTAETINGALYIRWTDLNPGKVTSTEISGGYNFIYSIPLKVQLNGQDFTQGYLKDGAAYIHWSALKTLNISYKFKGGVLFDIGGREVTGESINGGIYIRWNLLAPGKITFQAISGGYNFIYKP